MLAVQVKIAPFLPPLPLHTITTERAFRRGMEIVWCLRPEGSLDPVSFSSKVVMPP